MARTGTFLSSIVMMGFLVSKNICEADPTATAGVLAAVKWWFGVQKPLVNLGLLLLLSLPSVFNLRIGLFDEVCLLVMEDDVVFY